MSEKGVLVTTNELVSNLRQLKHELHDRFGIEQIALFGSYARNEADSKSDVDIAIVKMTKKDLFKRLQAKTFLETKLNKKVDIGYFDSMKTFIRNRIKEDLIYV
jgi:predicted nucleotidyltransferase